MPRPSPASSDRIPHDDRGFSAFFHRFQPLVYSVALRLVLNRDDANDVTQQVFLKVWNRPAGFRGGNVASWLTVLSRNTSRDFNRRRRKTVNGWDRIMNIGAPDNVEHEVIAAHNAEWLRRALRELPQKQRDVVVASFCSQMSHEAIARAEALPLGTVKTRIRSGLNRLRRRPDARQMT